MMSTGRPSVVPVSHQLGFPNSSGSRSVCSRPGEPSRLPRSSTLRTRFRAARSPCSSLRTRRGAEIAPPEAPVRSERTAPEVPVRSSAPPAAGASPAPASASAIGTKAMCSHGSVAYARPPTRSTSACAEADPSRRRTSYEVASVGWWYSWAEASATPGTRRRSQATARSCVTRTGQATAGADPPARASAAVIPALPSWLLSGRRGPRSFRRGRTLGGQGRVLADHQVLRDGSDAHGLLDGGQDLGRHRVRLLGRERTDDDAQDGGDDADHHRIHAPQAGGVEDLRSDRAHSTGDHRDDGTGRVRPLPP